MLVQSAKDWGSLPSNIKQATSQAASDAVDSRLSASTSRSWTEGGLRELNSPGHIGRAPPSMHRGSIAGTPRPNTHYQVLLLPVDLHRVDGIDGRCLVELSGVRMLRREVPEAHWP